jgi:hypothetical protein
VIFAGEERLDDVRNRFSQVRVYEKRYEMQLKAYGQDDPRVFKLARDIMASAWPIADSAADIVPKGNYLQKDMRDIINILKGEPVPPGSKSRLLAMLNCKKIVEHPGETIFLRVGEKPAKARISTVENVLPRAYVVGGVLPRLDRRHVFFTLCFHEFDPLAVALIDQSSVDAEEWRGLEPGRVKSELKSLVHGPNRLTVDVESEQEGLLVLSEAFHPGWQATVNGRTSPILKVNGAFRGVRVAQGDNHVEMIFRPVLFRIGSIVSLISLFATFVLIAVSVRRQRTEDKENHSNTSPAAT